MTKCCPEWQRFARIDEGVGLRLGALSAFVPRALYLDGPCGVRDTRVRAGAVATPRSAWS